MTNVQREKYVFVKSELCALLRRCDRTIEDVEYTVLEDGTEIVKVIWNNGYYQCVDITCDSLMQIAKDVLREVRV
jgi:hypothetical protein